MSRDEAEMEYLKIAQDLDMYGVNYFPITVIIHKIYKLKKIQDNFLPEQEKLGTVAGNHRPRPQHLRKREQTSTTHCLPMV
jgi:hypothetical protein